MIRCFLCQLSWILRVSPLLFSLVICPGNQIRRVTKFSIAYLAVEIMTKSKILGNFLSYAAISSGTLVLNDNVYTLFDGHNKSMLVYTQGPEQCLIHQEKFLAALLPYPARMYHC